jgi:hypothetical protein
MARRRARAARGALRQLREARRLVVVPVVPRARREAVPPERARHGRVGDHSGHLRHRLNAHAAQRRAQASAVFFSRPVPVGGATIAVGNRCKKTNCVRSHLFTSGAPCGDAAPARPVDGRARGPAGRALQSTRSAEVRFLRKTKSQTEARQDLAVIV